MKPLLLILAAALSVSAQTTEWKRLSELSGDIPDHPGLIVQVSATQIARAEDLIKLRLRLEYPNGAPYDIFKKSVPLDFDASSISRIEALVELNCKSLVVSPVKGSADVYQFTGKRHKSREFPFTINAGNVFAQYFCEQGEAPKIAPRLSTKP